MPSVEEIAAAHHRDQQRLIRRTTTAVQQLWRRVTRDRIAGSWRALLPLVVETVASAQVSAASQADPYTTAVLDALGIDADPAGQVNPDTFAGVASDGRGLVSLLYQPAIRSLTRIEAGFTPREALTAGLSQLVMITDTQVADAGRTADGVAIAARSRVDGYVRQLVLPSCARCVVLAGRFYRWNEGFLRHPMCDCRHIPANEDTAADVTTDPRRAVESGRVTDLSRADRQAIADGADVAQVVNAPAGMRTAAGRKVTTTGATRRGLAGQRLGARRGQRVTRLRPEQIYREAGSREQAIQLLRLHGYII